MSTAIETTETTTSLWCGQRIPFLGVTGDFGSGKTLFALSISPNCTNFDGEPDTLHWDTEGSADSYESIRHFEHRDLNQVMQEKYPQGYRPIQLFEHWLPDMRAVRPGQYVIGIIDAVSEIENGLCDWVYNHPEFFGHSKMQYTKMEGLYWGDVKVYWKQILSEAKTRFETLTWTSHLKPVWKNKQPVPGMKTAKGKETLLELASLYLILNRTAQPGQKKAPKKPMGQIFGGKCRLVRADEAGNLYPILPPTIPECTPDAVRGYIQAPANYGSLKKAEQAVEEKLSDEERLGIEAKMAEDKAIAAQSELSRVEMMKRGAIEQAASLAKGDGAKQSQVNVSVPASAISVKLSDPCTVGHQDLIRSLFKDSGAKPDQARAIIARRNGAKKIADLSIKQADELIANLRDKINEAAIAKSLDVAKPKTEDDIPY